MRRLASAAIAVTVLARTAAAGPFERDPRWWIEVGGGYGQSIDTGDGRARADLPAATMAVHLGVSSHLALSAELDLPIPLASDGALAAGLGVTAALAIAGPTVVDGGELTVEPRQFRSRLELVLRGTGGWASIYNDVSEGYAATSDDSFEVAGAFVRATAGVRWRIDSDRGWVTSLGVGLYPSATWLLAGRVNAGLSLLVGLGL